MSADVTQGYGPEMYVLRNAKPGDYRILLHYFATDANRTQVRSKGYLTVFKHFGDERREQVERHMVDLSVRGETSEPLILKVP